MSKSVVINLGSGDYQSSFSRVTAQIWAEETLTRKQFIGSLPPRVTFNLSTAFVNFFEGRAKYPTFKKRGSKQSVSYPQNVLLKLKYKSEECDRNYVEINRFLPSSQLCAETLLPIPELQKGFDSLGVRFVDCVHCGQKHDCDINALCRLQRLQRKHRKNFTLLTFSTTFQVDTELTSPKKVSTFHHLCRS